VLDRRGPIILSEQRIATAQEIIAFIPTVCSAIANFLFLHLARSVSIANNGSHAIPLWNSRFEHGEIFRKNDIKFVNSFLLVRRLHTAACAKDICGETCHATSVIQ
jgi:hypothetical protein